jgi:phosphatidylserine decarboxylase
MGATVILRFPKDTVEWDQDMVSGRIVRMGETLGRLATS